MEGTGLLALGRRHLQRLRPRPRARRADPDAHLRHRDDPAHLAARPHASSTTGSRSCAAAIAAVYPNMFQWEQLLFVEALILPMTLLLALLVFTGSRPLGE